MSFTKTKDEWTAADGHFTTDSIQMFNKSILGNRIQYIKIFALFNLLLIITLLAFNIKELDLAQKYAKGDRFNKYTKGDRFI